MKKTLTLSLLACAILHASDATNQFTLEKINVVASQGTSLEKKDITDSVTIISKEALEEARITNLAQALSQLGNISGTQNGGFGQSSSMYVRGMDSKRTLVLIDGVRYNDPTNVGASAHFEQIMLTNVAQIEIIKGAQSGIWGADASGGVINIVTSKAKKGFHAAANTEYGSFDSKKISLQTSYGADAFDIVLGGSLWHVDGFSATEPVKGDANYGKRFDVLGLEKDAYENKSFNAKLGLNITQNDRIEISAQTIDSLVHFDNYNGDSSVPKTEFENRFYTIAYKHDDALHAFNLQYNRSLFDRTTELPSWSGGIDTYNYQGSVEEVKIEDKISYFENSFLRLGGSYQKFEQEEITANTDKSYSAKSLFATNYNKFELFDAKPTIVTESLRYDDYNNFENALTGKLGIKQFLYEDIYFALNGGTGFNAPTLGELYGLWGANPNLKPEKSRTYDVTVGNDMLWATAYRNEIRDMIEYDMSTSAYVQALGTSTLKGFELGYKDFFLNQIGFETLYTYIDTQDANNKSLARRPKQQLDTKLVYYVSEDFDIGANAQYVGERYDEADKQGAQTGRYIVANAVANLKANKYVTFYGKIDNITDKYYQVVDGYATAGRSLYLGLSAKY